MAETKIEWTRSASGQAGYTFNGWIGCTEVSKAVTGGGGCDNCYARMSTPARILRSKGQETWGPGTHRVRTSPANWAKPIHWNALAAQEGVRVKVFCSSLADIFDNEVPIEWLVDVLELVFATPHLDWLFLTKRIGIAVQRLTEAMHATQNDHTRNLIERWLAGDPPANVWIGATVVTQKEADRDISKLLATPAVVRFLSVEPLLSAMDLTRWLEAAGLDTDLGLSCPGIDWVIVGGESGPKARPMHPEWVGDIRDQCLAAKVPFFFKQWGAWANPQIANLNLKLCYDNRDTAGWLDPDGTWSKGEGATPRHCGAVQVFKLKKQSAGRTLEGRSWDEMPATPPRPGAKPRGGVRK